MYQYFFSFQEFLKIIPGLLIFPISLYLGLQKIGTKVSARISLGNNTISPFCIKYVDLRNMKDRPIVIYSIWATFSDDDFKIKLKECNPPLILKGYQAVVAEIPPYSFVRLNGHKFELNKAIIEKTTIYLELAHSTVKCETSNYEELLSKKLSKSQMLENITNNFNGIIYDEHAVYAVTYASQYRVRTAIINNAGVFNGEWDFDIHQIPMKSMKSKEAVEAELKAMRFEDNVQWFTVHLLRKYL